MQDLNTDFSKICILPRPSGAPMSKAPVTIIKEPASTRAAFECNLVMQKCQDSIKATVKGVKSQIQHGANLKQPVMVMKRPVTT